MADRLLSAKKVAEILDISETQVHRLVEWGHLPAAKKMSKGLSKWFESDVQEYMTRLRFDALPPIPDDEEKPKRRPKPDTGSA